MIENIEFWGLILSICAGFTASFKMLWDIRQEISTNSQRITQTEAKIETLENKVTMEFNKCNQHCLLRRNGGFNDD